MRHNIYKEKILNLLKTRHLMGVAEIHAVLKSADFSTISRNINKLVAEQKIKKVILDKETVKYEINDSCHRHDHIICDSCGKIDSIKLNKITVKDFSFINVMIKGICKKCLR